jgi:hypothetical protein
MEPFQTIRTIRTIRLDEGVITTVSATDPVDDRASPRYEQDFWPPA